MDFFQKKVEPMQGALYSCIFPLLWNMKEFQRKIEKSKKICYFLILSAVRVSKWIRNTPRMFPTTYPTIKPHFSFLKQNCTFFQKSLPSSLKPTVDKSKKYCEKLNLVRGQRGRTNNSYHCHAPKRSTYCHNCQMPAQALHSLLPGYWFNHSTL